MNLGQLTPVLIAVLSAGGIFGGIVALLRVRPESGKLVVEAAEGAVVVQSGVITSLREELRELRTGLTEALEHRDQCEEELAEVALELTACRRELDEVSRRLAAAGINGLDRPAEPPRSGPQTTS